MDSTQSATYARFLQSGGQMGERIRNFDWSNHPLGPIEEWPVLLRTSLSICLNAGFPIAIYWGPELYLLYNDAWSAIPGDKHPWALGQRAADVWPDIWDTVGPQFEETLADGRSFRSTDQFLPMQRFGFIEETYFDYSLSPIFESDGSVAGVFNAGIETTYRIINERRNRFLGKLVEDLSTARNAQEVFVNAGAAFSEIPISIPFVIFYTIEADGRIVQANAAGLPEGMEIEPEAWTFSAVRESGAARLEPITHVALHDLPGYWPEAARNAILLPLYTDSTLTGFLVCAVSPRRIMDAAYQQYLVTTALHISTALTRSAAMAKEEEVRAQLAESEDNLRRLFMQAPMGICILSTEDMIVELVNDVYLSIVQRERASFEHRPLWEGLPEVRDQGFDDILRNVLRTCERFIGREVPVQILRNNVEETIYVDFVYEPMRENDGRCSRIMALVIDVTDKVQSRRAIELSEERARIAIESADLGTFDVDLTTDDLKASQRMADIMGVSDRNNRASYIRVLHPDDLHIRDAAYERAFKDGYLLYECRIIREDGSLRWCRFKGRIFFEDGKPVTLLGVVQDITEVKQFAAELTRMVEERTQALQAANAALERQNSELEQFAYVSSHDLQEPLRKIRMFADFIREHEWERLSELARNRFEKISASADRMSRSLRDLLEFASLDRAEHREPVDLNEVLHQVRQDLELAIAQNGAEIVSESLPTLPAIPLQMHQLLYNLVNNALKFVRPGVPPRVEVQCREVTEGGKEYYEIRVHDNGIGFSQQYAQRIFTIFQRLHDRSTYTGSGIGLAICKKVAENHGGSIRAEGRVGAGATFIVVLAAR
ncbi:MAG: PAS domain S-box protein [Chitinophagaceae bacterium]|nr:MAG: PAS domain S-box protein [Chitinophagaceae bacterium]